MSKKEDIIFCIIMVLVFFAFAYFLLETSTGNAILQTVTELQEKYLGRRIYFM